MKGFRKGNKKALKSLVYKGSPDFFGIFVDGFSSNSTLNSTNVDRETGKKLLEHRVKLSPKLAPNPPRINRANKVFIFVHEFFCDKLKKISTLGQKIGHFGGRIRILREKFSQLDMSGGLKQVVNTDLLGFCFLFS